MNVTCVFSRTSVAPAQRQGNSHRDYSFCLPSTSPSAVDRHFVGLHCCCWIASLFPSLGFPKRYTPSKALAGASCSVSAPVKYSPQNARTYKLRDINLMFTVRGAFVHFVQKMRWYRSFARAARCALRRSPTHRLSF